MKQSEQDIVDLDEVITSSEVEEEEEEKEESSNYAMDEYLSLLRKAAPMLGEVISPASDIKEYQEGIKQTLSGNLLGLPRAAAGLAGIFIPGSKYIREGGQKVSKIIDDKLKDLNTEEAITSYVIAPDKIDRTQLVNKINKDKNIQKKTDEFLNKKGFSTLSTYLVPPIISLCISFIVLPDIGFCPYPNSFIILFDFSFISFLCASIATLIFFLGTSYLITLVY